jgi:hypothetical protein
VIPLLRLGLRLAWGGGAREWVRSLSVAAASAAGVWVLLMTFAVLDAVLDSLVIAYGGQELTVFSAGVWISVGVPVVVLVATAGRLSASVRDRRLASLRLMGLPPSSTRVVAAVEVGVATLGGALVGAFAFLLVRALVPSIRLDVLVVRPPQTGWVTVGGVLLAVLLVSVAVAVAPTSRRSSQALASVRAAEVRGIAWWRLAPVTIAVVLLVATRSADVRDAGDPSTVQIVMLFAGAGLAGIGMLVLLPATVHLIAGALVHIPHPTVRLAGRRMQAQPAGVQRVVAGLLAALFVITGARMVLVAFEESDGAYTAARTAMEGGPQQIHVDVPRGDHGAVEAALRAHPLVDRVAAEQYVSTPCRGARSLCLTAFVGTCAELVEAMPGVSGCRDGEAAFVGNDALIGLGEPDPTLTWRANDSHSLTTPIPTATLEHHWSEDDLTYASVFLPETTPGVADLVDGGRPAWLVSATGGPTAAAQLRAALRDVTPEAYVSRDWRAADTAYIDTMRRGLWLMATLVVGIGLLSFVLGGIDRALSRRAESARLQVFGTPRHTIRNAQWIEALLPLLVGVPLAAGLGSFAGATFLHLAEGGVATPYTGVVAVVVATMAGSVLVAGLTVVAAAPRLRAELIRAE